MKFMFLTTEELDQMTTSMFSSEQPNTTCHVTFSEEEEMDVVELYQNGKTIAYDSIPLSDLLPKISKRLNQTFQSYDVMEVSDFGVGFVFFF